jgi:outer membrane receptor protein involved in Fe transport
VRAGDFGQQDVRLQTPNFSFERCIGADNFSLPNGTSEINDDYSITNGRVAYDHTLGTIAARFTAGVTDRHQGVPGPEDFLSPTSRQDDVTRDAQLSLATTHGRATTTLDLSGSSLDLAYTCNTLADFSCPNAFSFPLTPYAQLLTENREEVSLRTAIDENSSTIVAGIDAARGIARVDDGCDPLEVHPYAQTAVYVQDKWSIGHGDYVYAGVRGERDTTQGSASGGALSPSVGGIFRLSESFRLQLNAATAFRAPTADELYYPFFSNPNLVPERTTVGDLTITDDALLGGVSFGWFGIDGNNLIVDNASFIPENVGHAAIAGLTFTAKTRPVKGIYSSFNLTNLYQAQDLDSNPALDIYSGERLPSRGPVFQVNLELGYLSPHADSSGNASEPFGIIDSAAIEVRTQGPRGSVDPTLPLFDQPTAYSRVDAFIRIRTGAHALLTLRGFNLGDERYAEISGYPMPGRSFAVELSSR